MTKDRQRAERHIEQKASHRSKFNEIKLKSYQTIVPEKLKNQKTYKEKKLNYLDALIEQERLFGNRVKTENREQNSERGTFKTPINQSMIDMRAERLRAHRTLLENDIDIVELRQTGELSDTYDDKIKKQIANLDGDSKKSLILLYNYGINKHLDSIILDKRKVHKENKHHDFRLFFGALAGVQNCTGLNANADVGVQIPIGPATGNASVTAAINAENTAKLADSKGSQTKQDFRERLEERELFEPGVPSVGPSETDSCQANESPSQITHTTHHHYNGVVNNYNSSPRPLDKVAQKKSIQQQSGANIKPSTPEYSRTIKKIPSL